MGEVITYKQLPTLVKRLKAIRKRIVLVGGIFDLIHRGHVEFLEAAKKEGDILIVALESDKKTREVKGRNRPINKQEDRAFVISRFNMVDYILTLPYFKKDKYYEKLVKTVQSDIIAVTKADSLIRLKRKYAEAVGGKLVQVVSRIKNYSTSKIEEKL